MPLLLIAFKKQLDIKHFTGSFQAKYLVILH